MSSLPDIPSLELEPAPPPRAAASSRPPRPVAVVAPPEGPSFDDDDLDQGEPLQLDMPPEPVRESRAPAAPSREQSRSGIRLSVPPASSPPPPPDQAPAGPAIVLDPVEVERVGGYGPVPSYPWEAPVYAYRVWERRKLLRGLLVHARAAVTERARAIDDALVATLNDLRPLLLASPGSAALLEPSAAVQTRRDERLRAIAQVEDEAARELSEIDQEQEQSKLEIQHHRNEKDSLALEAAQLYEAARRGGPASVSLDEVRAKMTGHETAATGAITALASLRTRRRTREEAREETLAAHRADLAKIDAERRALLLEAGRSLAASQRPVGDASFESVQAAGEQHRLALRKVATIEAALGAYDHARVREAVLVVVVSLVTLGLLIALGVLRMGAELRHSPGAWGKWGL
jgi:uncharacterized protein YciI